MEYSINEAADKLDVGGNTVRRWVRTGRIRFRRLDDGYERPVIYADEVADIKAVKDAFGYGAQGLGVVLRLFNREPGLKKEIVAKAYDRLEEGGHE